MNDAVLNFLPLEHKMKELYKGTFYITIMIWSMILRVYRIIDLDCISLFHHTSLYSSTKCSILSGALEQEKYVVI